MSERLEWVEDVPAGKACNGCGTALGGGRGVRVSDPPKSMNPEERGFLFHNGECVASWAQRARLRATAAILNKTPDFLAHQAGTRQRGVEMAELEEEARVWRRPPP